MYQMVINVLLPPLSIESLWHRYRLLVKYRSLKSLLVQIRSIWNIGCQYKCGISFIDKGFVPLFNMTIKHWLFGCDTIDLFMSLRRKADGFQRNDTSPASGKLIIKTDFCIALHIFHFECIIRLYCHRFVLYVLGLGLHVGWRCRAQIKALWRLRLTRCLYYNVPIKNSDQSSVILGLG